MAAEAVVDFIGEDKKLLATLQGIEKNVKGLGGTMSNALKTGLSLFSAEKVLGFGKAAIQAAGATEKYKEKWDGINKSVNELTVAIGGPLIEMIDKLVPSIERITDQLQEWGPAIVEAAESGSEAWVSAQRKLAGIIGGLMPGVSADEAIAEFDRQAADSVKQSQQKANERKAQREREATFRAPSFDAIAGEAGKLFDLTPQQKAQRGINQGINSVFGAIGNAGAAAGLLGGAPAKGGGENPFLAALKEWGGDNLNRIKALGGVAEGFAKDAFLRDPGDANPEEASQARFTDLKGLFNQIQQAAASSPELDEAKKVATNTGSIDRGITQLVDNGKQMLAQLGKGVAAIAQ